MNYLLSLSAAAMLAAPVAAFACGGMSTEYDDTGDMTYEGRYPDPQISDLNGALRDDWLNDAEYLMKHVSLTELTADESGVLLHRHLISSMWEDGFDRNQTVDAQKLRIFIAMLEARADPNAPSLVGFTPLMSLALRGEDSENGAAQANALIEHGAEVDRRAEHGVTALQIAARSRADHVARALMNHGADPTLPDDDGQSANDIARAAGYADLETMLTPLQKTAAK